jgi:4-coumarate--CoA ligase
LQHPDIADVAVIGVNSEEQATELPRFVASNSSFVLSQAEVKILCMFRAYVMHANPASLKGDSDKLEFGKSVQEWIQTKVAPHKFLRGGVVIIDVVPKRSVINNSRVVI